MKRKKKTFWQRLIMLVDGDSYVEIKSTKKGKNPFYKYFKDA